MPSIIQLMFYSYVPESPKWLIRHGKMNEAEGYIRPLRPDDYNVKKEIESIIEETRVTALKSDNRYISYDQLLTHSLTHSLIAPMISRGKKYSSIELQ